LDELEGFRKGGRLFLEIGILILASTAILIGLFAPLPPTGIKPKRKRKYPTSGAILLGINEVFQPSAANSALIQEQQKESRKAQPSPEDPLEKN
jgi:hypothetical protein